jgi:hypothetical protein
MGVRRTGEGSNHFMKRTFILLVLIVAFSSFFLSTAYAQVQIRLRVIRASNVGQGFDPSLRDVHNELGSLFSFTSYRLLRDENLNLTLNRPVSISAHEGRIILETTLVGVNRGVADARIRVVREGTEILNTQVRLSPDRTVLIGGPRVRDGVIIYTLHAHF